MAKTNCENTLRDELRGTRKYLSEYSVFRKIWESSLKENNRFGNPTLYSDTQGNSESKNDIAAEARVKMFEIRRFVTSLPGGDEKLFLFLRYIHGETAESCAEKMGLSARHAYRLQKSAILMAHRELQKSPNEKRKICIES